MITPPKRHARSEKKGKREKKVLPGAGMTAVAISACKGHMQMQHVETSEKGGSKVVGVAMGLWHGGTGLVKQVLSIWKGGKLFSFPKHIRATWRASLVCAPSLRHVFRSARVSVVAGCNFAATCVAKICVQSAGPFRLADLGKMP